jgi:hypothetical protein
MRLALTLIFVSALLALAVLGPPALDAFHDRRHHVVVRRPLSVYQTLDERLRGKSNAEIARVTERDTLKVRRIRYEKDYMTVRVQLPEGRQGYIFSDANFRIYSPEEVRQGQTNR